MVCIFLPKYQVIEVYLRSLLREVFVTLILCFASSITVDLAVGYSTAIMVYQFYLNIFTRSFA